MTWPPGGLNLTAFDTRFVRIWWSLSASAQTRGHGGLQVHRTRRRPRDGGGLHGLGDPSATEGLEDQLDLAGLDPGEVEEVRDHPAQPVGVVPDATEVVPRPSASGPATPSRRLSTKPLIEASGRPQLVGDVAQEVRLQPVQLPEPGVGASSSRYVASSSAVRSATLASSWAADSWIRAYSRAFWMATAAWAAKTVSSRTSVWEKPAGLVADRHLPGDPPLEDQGDAVDVVEAEGLEEGALVGVELLGPLLHHRPVVPEVPGRQERLRRVADRLEVAVGDVVARALADDLPGHRLVEADDALLAPDQLRQPPGQPAVGLLDVRHGLEGPGDLLEALELPELRRGRRLPDGRERGRHAAHGHPVPRGRTPAARGPGRPRSGRMSERTRASPCGDAPRCLSDRRPRASSWWPA